jgi:hypothetical protein
MAASVISAFACIDNDPLPDGRRVRPNADTGHARPGRCPLSGGRREREVSGSSRVPRTKLARSNAGRHDQSARRKDDSDDGHRRRQARRPRRAGNR